MCGIFAAFAKQETPLGVSSDNAYEALLSLKHRGPDYQALLSIQGSNIALASELTAITPDGYIGHTRLSIIDSSPSANQPLIYKTPTGKHYVITYNGEIYNYAELKQSLKRQGYEFHTQSDTEIIPALYDAFGPECVQQLNGMFAFALWDFEEKELFTARDRYGIKPLYYHYSANGNIQLASELKALLKLPAVPKELCKQTLYEHLTFQVPLNRNTLLKNIHRLLPGHYAVWKQSTSTLTETCYWQARFQIDTQKPEQEWLCDIECLLSESVLNHLAGEVPIASFLSGGLDTSIIAMLTSRSIPNLPTFTCGFNTQGMEGMERYFDERQAANVFSKHINSRHHEIEITDKTLPEYFNQVIWHLDDFQAGISYQNFVISEAVTPHARVVLSGVGADELFAGYPWRYERFLQNPSPDNYYQEWVRLLNDSEKANLFKPQAFAAISEDNTNAIFKNAYQNLHAETPLQQALAFDFQYFLPALLIVEDRLSMAHGVESRVPFLDNRLVDLCLTMPDSLKLRNNSSKWGLREAFKNRLPEQVLTGRKQGFTPPDANWYRGPLKPWIEGMLLSEQALSRNLFHPKAIQDILEQHNSGQKNHRFLIWSLLCLEGWQRHFID